MELCIISDISPLEMRKCFRICNVKQLDVKEWKGGYAYKINVDNFSTGFYLCKYILENYKENSTFL